MRKNILKNIVFIGRSVTLMLFCFFLPVNADFIKCDNEEGLKAYLQQEFLKRKEIIEIQSDTYNLSLSQLSALSRSVKHNIRRTYTLRGDYLYEIMGSAAYMRMVVPTSQGEVYRYTVMMSYRETSQQTSAVDRKVKSILKKLKVKKYGNYKKVKLISEWIVRNIKYDYSENCNSAYMALKSQRATCMGYSLLAHKMLTAAGIRSKIVRGDVRDSGYHMWNAVKLKGNYYYLDTCWMDSGKRTANYEYFLFGERKCRRERTIQEGYELSNISAANYKIKY